MEFHGENAQGKVEPSLARELVALFELGDHTGNGDNKSRKKTLEMEVNSMPPNEMSKVAKERNTHKK